MRVCLIPAAGASSRMRGRDKLLEDVHGAPCLRVLAQRAIAAGAQVVVTLPNLDHPRAKALADTQAELIAVPNAQSGMSASLKAGVASVPDDAVGLMILPGDMPDVQAEDMTKLWERFERDRPLALQATTEDGLRGHPIIFSVQLLREFAVLSSDAGAFRILQSHEADVATYALTGNRARLDLDTPEDWEAWRAAQR